MQGLFVVRVDNISGGAQCGGLVKVKTVLHLRESCTTPDQRVGLRAREMEHIESLKDRRELRGVWQDLRMRCRGYRNTAVRVCEIQ
jgi:hypothetical protein